MRVPGPAANEMEDARLDKLQQDIDATESDLAAELDAVEALSAQRSLLEEAQHLLEADVDAQLAKWAAEMKKPWASQEPLADDDDQLDGDWDPVAPLGEDDDVDEGADAPAAAPTAAPTAEVPGAAMLAPEADGAADLDELEREYANLVDEVARTERSLRRATVQRNHAAKPPSPEKAKDSKDHAIVKVAADLEHLREGLRAVADGATYSVHIVSSAEEDARRASDLAERLVAAETSAAEALVRIVADLDTVRSGRVGTDDELGQREAELRELEALAKDLRRWVSTAETMAAGDEQNAFLEQVQGFWARLLTLERWLAVDMDACIVAEAQSTTSAREERALEKTCAALEAEEAAISAALARLAEESPLAVLRAEAREALLREAEAKADSAGTALPAEPRPRHQGSRPVHWQDGNSSRTPAEGTGQAHSGAREMRERPGERSTLGAHLIRSSTAAAAPSSLDAPAAVPALRAAEDTTFITMLPPAEAEGASPGTATRGQVHRQILQAELEAVMSFTNRSGVVEARATAESTRNKLKALIKRLEDATHEATEQAAQLKAFKQVPAEVSRDWKEASAAERELALSIVEENATVSKEVRAQARLVDWWCSRFVDEFREALEDEAKVAHDGSSPAPENGPISKQLLAAGLVDGANHMDSLLWGTERRRSRKRSSHGEALRNAHTFNGVTADIPQPPSAVSP